MRSDGSPGPADHRLRLFVALELPESVRTAVGAWTASSLATIASLRPVRVDGLHVTLCFLGTTAVADVEAIGVCCRAVCEQHRPLRLSIGELLALPRWRPRAIAVRVGDEMRVGDKKRVGDESGHRGTDPAPGTGREELIELQSGLAAALSAGGWYRSESRPFLAHVTAARVRSGARLETRALEERPPPPATFTADVVTLFESRTQPGGAVYRPRARIELAA